MNREQMRFEAAKAAMQGYLASYVGLTNAMPSEIEVSKNCVGYADALLAELDRTAPKSEAPKPDENGWIPHKPGDPMPCDGNKRVEILYACGEDDVYLARKISWTDEHFEYNVIAWKPA